MQKIKYIIIFTLLLALGLLYVQLSDYDKITNTLLNENSSSYKNIEKLNNQIILLENTNLELNNQVKSLENNNTNLNNQIVELQEEIISIDESISISQLPTQEYSSTDITETTVDINQEISLINKNNSEWLLNNLPVIPNATIALMLKLVINLVFNIIYPYCSLNLIFLILFLEALI